MRWPPASSDMPSSRWLPSSWRSVSQSASERSLTFLAPSFSSAGRLDPVGQDRPEGDQVGVDAGVRLDVGVRRAEQLAGVLGGERLDGVDVLAAGVEAVADRALGVLVAEPGAHRQQHRRRGVVLAGDQLERARAGRRAPARVASAIRGSTEAITSRAASYARAGGLGEALGHGLAACDADAGGARRRRVMAPA